MWQKSRSFRVSRDARLFGPNLARLCETCETQSWAKNLRNCVQYGPKLTPNLSSKLAHLWITHSNGNTDAYKKFGINFTKNYSLLDLNSNSYTCICNQPKNTTKFKDMKLVVTRKLTLKRSFLPIFGSILTICFGETLAPKSRETCLANLSLVSRETRRDCAILLLSKRQKFRFSTQSFNLRIIFSKYKLK